MLARILLYVFLLTAAALGAAEKPNIVLFLVDDMGSSDLGCYGSTFYETPQIDRLAREGLRFTQAYAACTVCSPTRACLLTGRNPAALRITDWIPGHARPHARLQVPAWTQQLSPQENTLARQLQQAGYATAIIGKWHLGPRSPTEYGFDLSLAGTDKGQPPSYFSPYGIPTLPDGPPGEFLTERLTSEAEKFIEAHQAQPFFLYLPHFAVHTPLMGKPEVVAKYQAKAKPANPQQNAKYAALVESVDDSVGRLRAKLEALHLTQKTLFVFTSDNGGLVLNRVTSNLGLRAGKGSAYEGGVRVPLIYCWPGRIAPGESRTVVTTGDHYYTVLDAANLPKPPASEEYLSLRPELFKEGALPSRSLFWHYPHYHPGGATPYSAVRDGDFKLIAFFEDSHLELYNLKDDPAETRNLVTTQPERAEALRQKLAAWWLDVHAQLPKPNPDYQPTAAPKPACEGGE